MRRNFEKLCEAQSNRHVSVDYQLSPAKNLEEFRPLRKVGIPCKIQGVQARYIHTVEENYIIETKKNNDEN